MARDAATQTVAAEVRIVGVAWQERRSSGEAKEQGKDYGHNREVWIKKWDAAEYGSDPRKD
jgi:hypothetical protein